MNINVKELKERTIKGRKKKVKNTIERTKEELLKAADSGLNYYNLPLCGLEEKEREEIKQYFEEKGLKVRAGNDLLGMPIFNISWS